MVVMVLILLCVGMFLVFTLAANIVIGVWLFDFLFMLPISIFLIKSKRKKYKVFGIINLLINIAPFITFFVLYSLFLRKDENREHPVLSFIFNLPDTVFHPAVFYNFLVIAWIAFLIGIGLFASGFKGAKKIIKEYDGNLKGTVKSKWKSMGSEIVKIVCSPPLILVNIIFVCAEIAYIVSA
ncbi:hypothetical protein FACS1894132_01760 [Clostridia bacterium]|nr:hypothetical protein FACS1894132_01760 [Clostridia bacterium]